MKFVLLTLSMLVWVGCEKQPPEEEVPPQRATEAARSPKPTPKPGDWMWKEKERNNPLEKPKDK